MSVTTEDVMEWKTSLEALLDDVADDEARASLAHLRSALEPYFETPELFRAILGKIQMMTVPTMTQSKLTSTDFENLDELKAILPEGLTVTTLQ